MSLEELGEGRVQMAQCLLHGTLDTSFSQAISGNCLSAVRVADVS
jgi:hypothetical protein